MMFHAFITVLLAFSFSTTSTASPAKRSCSLQGFQELCAQIPQTDDAFIRLPDGSRFRNPHQLRAPSPALSAAETRTSRERLEKKFAWVKQKMIAEIRAGRADAEMNTDQKMFISRLQDLRLNMKSVGCAASPSGQYVAQTNEIAICPQMGLQSDAQLTWLLAHEAGHAIDGCNCQHARMRRHHPLSATARNPVSVSSRPVFSEINRGTSFLAGPPNVPADVMKVVNDAEKSGGVTRLDAGMNPANHPLNRIMSCMVEKKILAPGHEMPPQGIACRETGSFSETPSDIWGARITGLMLQEKPPTSDLGKLASLSQESIDLMCAPRTGPKPRRALNDAGWDSSLPASGRYIEERFRDEATFLADPNIQWALGCERNPRMGSCMAEFPDAMRDWGRQATGAPASQASPEDGVH